MECFSKRHVSPVRLPEPIYKDEYTTLVEAEEIIRDTGEHFAYHECNVNWVIRCENTIEKINETIRNDEKLIEIYMQLLSCFLSDEKKN